jgi:hypothetical protein
MIAKIPFALRLSKRKAPYFSSQRVDFIVMAVLPANELPLQLSGDMVKYFLPSLFYQAQESVHSAIRRQRQAS